MYARDDEIPPKVVMDESRPSVVLYVLALVQNEPFSNLWLLMESCFCVRCGRSLMLKNLSVCSRPCRFIREDIAYEKHFETVIKVAQTAKEGKNHHRLSVDVCHPTCLLSS
jgi:hypothetical protein